VRKLFDKVLYEENDKNCKEALMKLMVNVNKLNIQVNPKKRGVDLLVFEKDKHIFNIEVERKRTWKKEFLFNSVQFPERKNKYCQLELPTLFVMFNEDYSQFLAVTSKDLISSPKAMVRNKYVPYGEFFFQVPLDKVIFNNIEKAIREIRKLL
jgi:hypothetical protein